MTKRISKKSSSIKAWAVVSTDIDLSKKPNESYYATVSFSKRMAKVDLEMSMKEQEAKIGGLHIIPVLITPIKPAKRALT